jgi:hypothetical protein
LVLISGEIRLWHPRGRARAMWVRKRVRKKVVR